MIVAISCAISLATAHEVTAEVTEIPAIASALRSMAWCFIVIVFFPGEGRSPALIVDSGDFNQFLRGGCESVIGQGRQQRARRDHQRPRADW